MYNSRERKIEWERRESERERLHCICKIYVKKPLCIFQLQNRLHFVVVVAVAAASSAAATCAASVVAAATSAATATALVSVRDERVEWFGNETAMLKLSADDDDVDDDSGCAVVLSVSRLLQRRMATMSFYFNNYCSCCYCASLCRRVATAAVAIASFIVVVGAKSAKQLLSDLQRTHTHIQTQTQADRQQAGREGENAGSVRRGERAQAETNTGSERTYVRVRTPTEQESAIQESAQHVGCVASSSRRCQGSIRLSFRVRRSSRRSWILRAFQFVSLSPSLSARKFVAHITIKQQQ